MVGTPATCRLSRPRDKLSKSMRCRTPIHSAILYNLLTGQAPNVEPGAPSPHDFARVLDGPPKLVHTST